MLKLFNDFTIKIIFRTFKRILVITFLILAVLLYNGVQYLEVYSVILLVLLSVFSSLKAKEIKENWKCFFVSLLGYDIWVSLYGYVLTILFANILMTISGMIYLALCIFGYHTIDIAIFVGLFKVTNLILFYYLIVQFISEFIKYEHLIILQKILVLLAIYLFISLKNVLGESSLFSYYIQYLLILVLFFNYALVFILHELLLKKRSVFK
jgi:hypothetical protein